MDKRTPARTVNSEVSAPEPKPFFVFDKPFMEHEEYRQSYAEDGEEDYISGDQQRAGRRIPTSRQSEEFCTVKSYPSFNAHREKARLMPICCAYCLPKSKLQISEINKDKGIANCLVLKPEMESNADYWYTKWVPYVLKYFWRRSSIVKQYNTVKQNDIKNDPELCKAIIEYEKMSTEEQRTLKAKILSFVETVCMIPLSRFRFMLSSWAVRLFLKCVFGAVFVHTGQIEQLKLTQDKGLPMIFIPLHRSVLDPIVLFWALTHYNIPSPFFFSGDLMDTDYLLQKLASLTGVRVAFKNDVESDDNELVTKSDIICAGVSAYLRTLLKNSNNCEILLEPNRSRSGLPSTCLYGSEVVAVLISLFESKQLEDAYIVPVCTTYERLPEEDEYLIANVHGQKVNGLSYLNLFCQSLKKSPGNVRVDFGQPFSLREFKRELSSTMEWAVQNLKQDGYCLTIASSELRWNDSDCPTPSLPSFYGEMGDTYYTMSDKEAVFVNLLANHTIYDASKCGAIMSSHILAFFLIKKYPNGLNLDKLVQEFEDFQKIARDKNRDLGFRGNMKDVILRAIDMFGPNLVSMTKVEDVFVIKAVDNPEVKLKLCYYANHVTPMFALEAVFATTLFSLCENSITIPAFISEREIMIPVKEFAEAFKQVFKLLKSEFFIYPPCKSVDKATLMCLDEFQSRGIIGVVEKKRHRERHQDDDDDWDSDPAGDGDGLPYTNENIFVTLSHQLIDDQLMFWKNLVVGYLEVYRTCCFQLFALLPNKELEEEIMLKQMLEFSLKYSRQHICEDVLSSNTVQNFVNRMLELNVLGYYDEAENKKRYFYLGEDFASSSAIDQLYETFDRYVFYP